MKFDINTFAQDAHKIAVEAATAQYDSQITTPIYRHPGPISKQMPKYKAQAKRISEITKQSSVDIQGAKDAFQELVKVTDVQGVASSSVDAPLSFDNNMHLKFRVLSALMAHTGLVIPASSLGPLKNVNDVVAFYQKRVEDIETVTKARATRQFMPSNVKIITNKSIMAKHGY